jgi:hypothetical protein
MPFRIDYRGRYRHQGGAGVKGLSDCIDTRDQEKRDTRRYEPSRSRERP